MNVCDEETGTTTFELSFVSVTLGEVSSVNWTVPAGAWAPENVTGRASVRFRFKRISPDRGPFENAKDSM